MEACLCKRLTSFEGRNTKGQGGVWRKKEAGVEEEVEGRRRQSNA